MQQFIERIIHNRSQKLAKGHKYRVNSKNKQGTGKQGNPQKMGKQGKSKNRQPGSKPKNRKPKEHSEMQYDIYKTLQ